MIELMAPSSNQDRNSMDFMDTVEVCIEMMDCEERDNGNTLKSL